MCVCVQASCKTEIAVGTHVLLCRLEYLLLKDLSCSLIHTHTLCGAVLQM